MGEISLSINSAINITLLVAFIYVISRMIYGNVYADNMMRAKESDEYKSAIQEYNEMTSIVYEHGIASKLPELCLRYREEELRAYRTAILADMCITYDEYVEKYSGASHKDLISLGLSKDIIACIERAQNAKGVDISPDTLLSGDSAVRQRNKIFSRTSERRRMLDLTKDAVGALAKTLLVGVVGVSVAFDFSLAAIVQWGVRMMPIVSAAISAAPAGQRNIYDVAIPHIRKKTEVLKLMLSWENISK
jgi:hypothetical protein